jgi:hypothetical protein
LQLSLARRALVQWWHSFAEAPSFNDLFEYLLVSADVWRRPLRDQGDSSDGEGRFTPTSLEWRVIAPAPVMFTAADPFFNYSEPPSPSRKRKRAELEDDVPRTPLKTIVDKGKGMCESCHRLPKPPNGRVCAACRLTFEAEGITPPGYVRNRSKMLRPACSECQAKPARKGSSKCEGCAYAASTTACVNCGTAGVKIAKGLCPACFKKAARVDTRKTGGGHEEDMEDMEKTD